MDSTKTKPEGSLFSPDTNGLDWLLDFLKKRVFQDPNRSLSLIDQGLKVANAHINPTYKLYLLTYKGGILIQKGLFPHALGVFEEALPIAAKLKDDLSISRIYNNLGLIYKSQEKYSEALEVYLKCLKFSDSKQNPYIYVNIGSILYIRKEYDKSLQYFTNALYLAEKNNETQVLCVCCINIGDFYKEQGNYTKAIEYLERGLSIATENDEFILHNGLFLQSIGSIWGLMKSYEDALNYINQATKIFRDNGFYLNLAQSLFELSKVYFDKDQFDNAVTPLKESIEICKEHRYSSEQIDSLKLLIKCTNATKNLEVSNQLLQELVELQHQHFTEDKELKVREIISTMENEVDVLTKKNQEIEKKNSLLAASNQELNQYAHIIAHDLKEPLRNINSFTNLLGRYNKSLLVDDSKEFMEIIERNAAMMSKKLDDLLRYVGINMDNEKLKLVDVEAVIYKVLDALKNKIQEKNILVEVEKMTNVYGTPPHINELFYHLVKNAIDYSSAIQDPRTIQISSTIKDNMIEYCVADNGIGIHPDYHKKIFKIFNQLEKYGNGGTGVGLSICEKIVRLYDGTIRLESEEGKGTKVYFTMMQREV